MNETGEPGKDRKPWHFKPGGANPRHTMPDRSGRQPGSPNKLTRVKDAVLGAFDEVGAQKYLVKMARSKKPALRALFVQLLAKTIPQEVTGKDGGPIEIHVLQIAKQGLAKLSDERLQLLYDILLEIGVHEIVLPAANDETEAETVVPMLTGPASEGATA